MGKQWRHPEDGPCVTHPAFEDRWRRSPLISEVSDVGGPVWSFHALLFDGPGQGRALIDLGLKMRPEWEQVVSPVIDYVVTLPEVDVDGVALVGWSFGGFLAPRAAAFEPRLAA